MSRWILRILAVAGVAAIAFAYAYRPGGEMQKRELEKLRRTIGRSVRDGGTPEMKADWSKADDDGVLSADEFAVFWRKYGQTLADQSRRRSP